ncbi:threonine synthase [Thermaurantiacus sp.]
MEHVSTRGEAPPLDFRGATLSGLAPDGGLYVPAQWPRFTPDGLRALRLLSYAETATRVLRAFVGTSLAHAELEAAVAEAYAGFTHPAVTPLVQLDHQHFLLELHHGPTLAFKDLALQLLGRLFARFHEGGPLLIVGATSGDTGSAAIAGVAGVPGLRIAMLHPKGRVSEVQRRQMTTVVAPNVLNLAVEGSFDDCQALVKALFHDAGFRARHRLSAVNSINWARLAAQTVYYVYAAVRLGAPDRAVAFAVPTGNFGDVFSGYVAARMGLPVARLLVATNANDILARALNAGDYSKAPVVSTLAPAMDIQVASNFERLLFDLLKRDTTALAEAMAVFEATGRLPLEAGVVHAAARLFTAQRIDADEAAATMRWALEAAGLLIDPHTSIGLAAARRHGSRIEAPIVTLATAHPAKFGDAVEAATGVRPLLPARLAGLFDQPEQVEVLPNSLDALRARLEAFAA